MNQGEILQVLHAKLRAGSITRRQMVQAAAFFGISAVALPEAATAAPISQPSRLQPRAQAEGEVRFLIAEAFWADWHQYLSTAQSQRRLGLQLFDTLVQIESDDFSNVTPGLAESWTQVDDVTWEFTLRQGVSFHNGQPFSGADVKASIELATGTVTEETTTASRWVPTTVEIIDDTTARNRHSIRADAERALSLAHSLDRRHPALRGPGHTLRRYRYPEGVSERDRAVQACERRAEREDT
jgi:ABC-type transport system substrate-binding protein